MPWCSGRRGVALVSLGGELRSDDGKDLVERCVGLDRKGCFAESREDRRMAPAAKESADLLQGEVEVLSEEVHSYLARSGGLGIAPSARERLAGDAKVFGDYGDHFMGGVA